MTYGIAFGSNLFDINKTFLLQKVIKIVVAAQRRDLLKKFHMWWFNIARF
jgi:hypothetical protein